MKRAITTFLLTILVGYVWLVIGSSRVMTPYPEYGSIFAIAFVGAMIVYYNEKDKKDL